MVVRPAPQTVDLHFALDRSLDYTLRGFGETVPLRRREDPRTTAESTPQGASTHVATVAPVPGRVALIRIYGPVGDEGVPTLASLALHIDGYPTPEVHGPAELAQALMFLHPSLTVLMPTLSTIGTNGTSPHQTPCAANVLQAITADENFEYLTRWLEPGRPWNRPEPLTSEDGLPLLKADGTPWCRYVLVDEVENLRALVSTGAITRVHEDPTLRGARWHRTDGLSHRPAQPLSATRPVLAVRSAGVAADGRESAGVGYSYELQDPGPDCGFSAEIRSVTSDGTITLRVSNSYIRHGQVSFSFLGTDMKAIVLEDDAWLRLLRDFTPSNVGPWYDHTLGQDILDLLFDSTKRLKFAGPISPEDTFLGVPVAAAESEISFQMPTEVTIGKVRIIVGSLGTPSGNDWDPKACWIGIGMTVLLDLVIPTVALVMTVGEESKSLLDSILKDAKFILVTAAKLALLIKDVIEHPDMAGEDLSAFFLGLADKLLEKVLTSTEVLAKLAAYFGAEEAEEAIPIVGWAIKAALIQAGIEQLAQTIAEVSGSTRVTEFGLTVTMPVRFTLLPTDATGFANTATTYTVTAQYSEVTGYIWNGEVPDDKTAPITFTWDRMPVGGKVSFVVALYSAEGWLVGRGATGVLDNVISSGQDALVVPPITIEQLLYPLTAGTTYVHERVLGYEDGAHAWTHTTDAPAQTARDLGVGPGPHNLEALTSIGLNSDLGILGYGWQATGQGVPMIGTDDQSQPVHTFQNIAIGSPDRRSVRPDDGLMFTPAGYPTSPVLAYVRTAADRPPPDGTTGDGGPGASGFLFLDPVADDTRGYHLRPITPVNDASIGPDSAARSFDLGTTLSCGRFRLRPTSIAIHGRGFAVGVTPEYPKLQVLDLGAGAGPSGTARWSTLVCGPGATAGMLREPEVVAIAPDQTVLVLEAGNKRIQAFGRTGHPIKAFDSTPDKYWIPLHVDDGDSTQVTYVSMSVEIQGHIYVLSIENQGYDPREFRLDVYTPSGAHLLRQRGMSVAAMTVDLWRNLYSLDYASFLGPAQRTEPAVSEWIPSTPKTEN